MDGKKSVYNLIILDESGSMESIKDATISGFNELIQTIQFEAEKDPELKHWIQLDITHYSLPFISEDSLPAFQSKVYHCVK